MVNCEVDITVRGKERLVAANRCYFGLMKCLMYSVCTGLTQLYLLVEYKVFSTLGTTICFGLLIMAIFR